MKPHGKEFKQKIKELNEILSINIATKHRYVSWYRCDGKCKYLESCLFGYVSRACHKTSADLAAHELHRVFCGGTFSQTEEPSKDLLKLIMKQYKLIKSSKRCKKTTSLRDNEGVKVVPNHKHLKIVDYVTSEEEV